jgi:hypothetical protein
MEWFTDCLEEDCTVALVSSPGKNFAGRVDHGTGIKSHRNSPDKIALKRRKMLEGPGTPKVWTEIRMKF